MINYVVAVATAVTLMISPALGTAKSETLKQKRVEWTKPFDAARTVEVQRPIEVSGSAGPYVLSQLEQKALRRALFRSLNIVHPGELA